MLNKSECPTFHAVLYHILPRLHAIPVAIFQKFHQHVLFGQFAIITCIDFAHQTALVISMNLLEPALVILLYLTQNYVNNKYLFIIIDHMIQEYKRD